MRSNDFNHPVRSKMYQPFNAMLPLSYVYCILVCLCVCGGGVKIALFSPLFKTIGLQQWARSALHYTRTRGFGWSKLPAREPLSCQLLHRKTQRHAISFPGASCVLAWILPSRNPPSSNPCTVFLALTSASQEKKLFFREEKKGSITVPRERREVARDHEIVRAVNAEWFSLSMDWGDGRVECEIAKAGSRNFVWLHFLWFSVKSGIWLYKHANYTHSDIYLYVCVWCRSINVYRGIDTSISFERKACVTFLF